MEGEMKPLPEGRIANAISFRTPRDACRLSSVSAIFKSAADSDGVWERFLPPDYMSLLSSSSACSSLSFSSKKELYFNLCRNPIVIDEGRKSFWLEKQSGKKCYMISARELLLVWADTPTYWRWISVPEARFPEVAELICVCWFEIRGKISTTCLSPWTLYAAYLVYKPRSRAFGFEYLPIEKGGVLDYLIAAAAGVGRLHCLKKMMLFIPRRERMSGWRSRVRRFFQRWR